MNSPADCNNLLECAIYWETTAADRIWLTQPMGGGNANIKTWTWADWKLSQLGYCTFVNFGRNYAGPRDEYVYTVTHDGPMADGPADRMILMRVPKAKVPDRAAYEFFAGLDAEELALFSSASTVEVAERNSANAWRAWMSQSTIRSRVAGSPNSTHSRLRSIPSSSTMRGYSRACAAFHARNSQRGPST